MNSLHKMESPMYVGIPNELQRKIKNIRRYHSRPKHKPSKSKKINTRNVFNQWKLYISLKKIHFRASLNRKIEPF